MDSVPETDTPGCEEHRFLLSRRGFLGVSAGLFTASLLPDIAFANGASADPRLLLVILRGGLDGLSTLVPHGDPDYEQHRGDLAIDRGRIVRLDSQFGLHPELNNILRFYRAGDAAFIPAAGLPVQSRSHFECQANLENGLPGNNASSSGWVNRLIGALPVSPGPQAGNGLTIGPVPQILTGPAPVLSWTPTWFGPPVPQVLAGLERMYRAGYGELATALARGLEADRMASSAAGNIGSNLPALDIGFRGAGRLLSAARGPRIAVLSVSGWDTHNAQGNLSGQIANRLSGLDAGLAAFRREVSDAVWAQTVILCVTEFGRSVPINGTNGTDHGVGMPVILVGGAVNGGIRGDWPGLAPGSLIARRDLRPTVDLRSVFKGVLRDHLGVAPRVFNRNVFPNSLPDAPPMGGLIRAPSSASGLSELAGLPVSSLASRPAAAQRDMRSYRSVHGLS